MLIFQTLKKFFFILFVCVECESRVLLVAVVWCTYLSYQLQPGVKKRVVFVVCSLLTIKNNQRRIK